MGNSVVPDVVSRAFRDVRRAAIVVPDTNFVLVESDVVSRAFRVVRPPRTVDRSPGVVLRAPFVVTPLHTS